MTNHRQVKIEADVFKEIFSHKPLRHLYVGKFRVTIEGSISSIRSIKRKSRPPVYFGVIACIIKVLTAFTLTDKAVVENCRARSTRTA